MRRRSPRTKKTKEPAPLTIYRSLLEYYMLSLEITSHEAFQDSDT